MLNALKEGQLFFVMMFLEMDECLEGTAGCSHRCENTQGSYLCLCSQGFQLDSEAKNCIGKYRVGDDVIIGKNARI